MGFLEGKRAVIVGLASNRSIAWGIAQALRAQGAELAFNYQTEKLKGRVEKMAAELDSDIALPLDVTEDDQIQDFFGRLSKHWDGFDILIHSVAYAPAEQLRAVTSRRLTEKAFGSPTTFPATALQPLQKPAAR